jgi:hypothetical protein
MTNKNKNNDYSKFEIKLTPVFEWEGKFHETITFDFGKLKGKDFIEVENEMSDNREYSVKTAESDPRFCYRIAARACGIGADVLSELPMSSFNQIVNAVRRFLNHTEYEDVSDNG